MQKRDLKGSLKNNLSPDELKLVPRSFDIIGSREKAVAIIEVPEKLKPHAELIAKALMHVHKNVKSVLSKETERSGIYRLMQYDLLFGEPDTEVIHKEHGCSFKLDPQKAYFSPREGTERLRIAGQSRPNETILVLFSGVGPFPIILAKKQPKVKKVYAVELNPIAHNYCVENVQLNKLEDKVLPILGDVREICPTLVEEFDRVLMPLPKGAYGFLDVTLPCLQDGGILHFYHWASEQSLFLEAKELVSTAAKKLGKQIDILNETKVLPYGPRKWKVCLDIRVR